MAISVKRLFRKGTTGKEISGKDIEKNQMHDSKGEPKSNYQSQALQYFTPDPSTIQPKYPIKEQVKEEMTTSAFYKAVFSKGTIFSTPMNNLSMENLKYVIPTAAEDEFMFDNKLDELKKKFRTKLRENIPDRLYGGGEEDLLSIEMIDLKKTYNETKKATQRATSSGKPSLAMGICSIKL